MAEAASGVRPPLAALRALSRHPVTAAAAGLLIAEALAVLPAQIRWADSGELWTLRVLPYESPLGNLRLMTVSRTLLLGERSGAPGLAHEALWCALFLGMLLSTAWAVAARIGGGDAGRRALALCLALTAFAPQAHLLALTALRLPDLLLTPSGRGTSAQELLEDAREGAAHAVLMALFACAAVALTRLGRRSRERHGQLPAPQGELPGLPSRIAAAAAVGLGATGTLGLFTSIGAARAVWPAAESWCAHEPEPGTCVGYLVGTLIRPRPYYAMPDVTGQVPQDEFPSYNGPFFLDSSLTALLVFATTCAVVAYAVRASAPHTGSPPLTALLTGWLAFTWAAVGFLVPLRYELDPSAYDAAPPASWAALLIPPTGLQYALLAAPLFAVLLAAATRLRRAVPALRR